MALPVKYALRLDHDNNIVGSWSGRKPAIPDDPAYEEVDKLTRDTYEHDPEPYFAGIGTPKYKYSKTTGEITENTDVRPIGTFGKSSVQLTKGGATTTCTLTLNNNYTGKMTINFNDNYIVNPTFTNGMAVLTITTATDGRIILHKAVEIQLANSLEIIVDSGDAIEVLSG